MHMKREMASSLKLGLAIAVVLVMVISEARELRPSDHGLVYYQSGNTSEAPAEAKSFFSGGGGGGGEGGESGSGSGSGGMALPKAMNSSDTSWWEGVSERGGGRRDHVRDVLVVVSLVCGITGVVLFVASAFVYVSRHHRKHNKPGASSPSS